MKLCLFNDGQCVQCGAPQINARQVCGAFTATKPGLGDRIAFGLSVVGITKERAKAVAQAVGLKDCGCEQRQQLLNELGYAIGIGTPPDKPPA